MVHICEIFAAECDIKFNEEKTVAIIFYCLAMVNHQSECHLELDGVNRRKGLYKKTVIFLSAR